MRALVPDALADGRAAHRPLARGRRCATARRAATPRTRSGRSRRRRRSSPTIARLRTGAEPVAAATRARPRRELHAQDQRRRGPSPPQARALDAYFTLAAEHGMNASTFTARVIVSTLSDLGSGLVGAVGALKGRLHGGAPSHVSHMIDEIGTRRERRAVAARAARGGRAPDGLRPPRLPDLRPARPCARRGRRARSRARTSASRSPATSRRRRCACSHEYKPDRPLYTNVEYYAAAVLGGVDLPPDLYPATFAAARTAGWTAHMLEQLAHNRLIRPVGRLRRADARAVLIGRAGALQRLRRASRRAPRRRRAWRAHSR